MMCFARARFFLAVLFGVALSCVAQAGAPPEINVHGQLLDAANQPLSGVRAYVVRFFPVETGGTQLGGDISGSVTLPENGLFDLAITPPAAALDAEACWYELAIESEAVPDGSLQPSDVFAERVRVYSVPFALRAASVPAGGVGNGQLSDAELAALDGVTSSVQAQINSKADDEAVDLAVSILSSAVAVKANAADVYTKSEVDVELAAVNQALARVLLWTVITESVQAEPNRGYIANGESALYVTLPPEGSVSVGDIVRVNGVGTGGWRIAQNLGQRLVIPDSANAWLSRATTLFWTGLAISDDGKKYVACVQNGFLYTSVDGGANWVGVEVIQSWSSVDTTADGSLVVACANPGFIQTSSDGGTNWTPRDEERAWSSVAVSDDGTAMYAADYLGKIYTSSDLGESWTARDDTRNWVSVDCSEGGDIAVAAVFGGTLYTSTDSGAAWTSRDSVRNWIDVATSEDGAIMLACVADGQIYTSTDSGLSWAPRESNRPWRSVACSDDGTRMLASEFNGRLYVSTDYGVSWAPQADTRSWNSVAMSDDGKQLAAVATLDYIYVNNPTSQLTASGSGRQLIGGQYTAVELQYIGGGIFTPISHEGTIVTD